MAFSVFFGLRKGWEELGVREEYLAPGRAALELGLRGQLEGPTPGATRHLSLRLLGLHRWLTFQRPQGCTLVGVPSGSGA